MFHKIVWQGDAGHIEEFIGSIERVHHKDGGWSFMVTSPERRFLKVSKSHATIEEMENEAIRYLINKGELS